MCKCFFNWITGVTARRKRRLLELRRQRLLRDFDILIDDLDDQIDQAKGVKKIRLINEKYHIIMWRTRIG